MIGSANVTIAAYSGDAPWKNDIHPGYTGHHRRNGQTSCQRQHRGLRREVHIREGDAGSIRANSEKSGLTEGEDAGIAPKDIHRQRRRGVKEGTHKDVDGIGIEKIGPGDGRHYAQPGNRANGHKPARRGPAGQSSGVVVRSAITEPRGPDTQEQGCENHDGQSANHRADEGGNEHLCTSKRERRGRETCERY